MYGVKDIFGWLVRSFGKELKGRRLFVFCTLTLTAYCLLTESFSNKDSVSVSRPGVTRSISVHHETPQPLNNSLIKFDDAFLQGTGALAYQILDYHTDKGREPIDNFLGVWKDMSSFSSLKGMVRYLRSHDDISKRHNCASMPNVLQWLTTEMIRRECSIMVAYGGLIHVFREGDFANRKNGKYFDDDLDLWASSSTAFNIMKVEAELFETFGWTVRTFSSNAFVVLLQVISCCGHSPANEHLKAKSNEPSLEVHIQHKGTKQMENVMLDFWHGNRISQANLYPPLSVEMKVTGFPELLRVQVPNQPEIILKCLYGNWKVFSNTRGPVMKNCTGKKLQGVAGPLTLFSLLKSLLGGLRVKA